MIGCETAEMRVHPCGISAEFLCARRIERGEFCVRQSPQTQGADQAIHRESSAPFDFGRGAPSQAPQPQHLSQAVLRVRKPQAKPGFNLMGRTDVRHTPRIPADRDGT